MSTKLSTLFLETLNSTSFSDPQPLSGSDLLFYYIFQNKKFKFTINKRRYLYHFCPNIGLKGTVVNVIRACKTLYEEGFKNTLTKMRGRR